MLDSRLNHGVAITGPNAEPIHSRTDIEPNPGSVVLTSGEWGTAWQRHFSDGLWHRSGSNPSRPKTWAWLCAQRNTVLVYDARERLGS